MAQKNRTKEVWLIPKRVNLHQTICLIDGIIERNYSGTTWNPQKQNNLGVNLKKWGATNSGKNISPQALRTLVASIPQYLGFLYINTNTTPNTICVTDAGYKLWEYHKDDLKVIKNLREGKKDLIKTSNILLLQMEKLQITNPIILKDCENIFIFPFRLTLKLLLEFKYLDREELGYILFTKKEESEYELIKEEIKNFRNMSIENRDRIINVFKKTHIGNITLVQAPSAGYYESLCEITGIIEKIKIKIHNPDNNKNKKLSAIKLKEEFENVAKEIVFTKYRDVECFDFKNDLDLWVDYIGNPNRLTPPKEFRIVNKSKSDILISIYKEEKYLYSDFLEKNKDFFFPMFENEEYKIKCQDIIKGELIGNYEIDPFNNLTEFEIKDNGNKKEKKERFDDIVQELLEHSKAKMFNKKTLNYLSILYKLDGKDRDNNKSLRGAYYEFLFYKVLTKLVEINAIDEVFWNGKIGQYGLPSPAPGGKLGTPDIIFKINNIDFVLEVTTIKSRSLQFRAEGASVPDHIKLYKQNLVNKVIGIFVAPKIYSRNTASMESILNKEEIKIHCLDDKELLNIFMKKDKKYILEQLC